MSTDTWVGVVEESSWGEVGVEASPLDLLLDGDDDSESLSTFLLVRNFLSGSLTSVD